MKLHKPVRWKEGMFLRPQHFQQYDLYLESREIGRFRAVESHCWGLMQLEVDTDALDNFVFNLKQFRAVLPNGTLIDLAGNARINSRSFEGLMDDVGRPMDVHVGVRAMDDRGPLTPAEGGGMADTRFIPSEDESYDLDSGRDPAPLERLVYNLRIFFGDEPTDGYETLPISRVKLSGKPIQPVDQDETFSPPCLVLSASHVLRESTRAVVERLVTGLRELGQQRGSKDPDPLILYYGLSGSLPVLKDMVQEGLVHPRRVYHELARLAGALLYRDQQGRSSDAIPEYDHRDPGPVFDKLRDLIAGLIPAVVDLPYLRCPMERDGDQFKVVMPDKYKAAGTRFYIEVNAEDSAPRLKMLMLGSKISNPGRIQLLRDGALPGVRTEHLPGPPPELPPGQTGIYFRLKSESDEWTTHVHPSGQLELFMLNAPEDISMNVIVCYPAPGA